MINVQIVDDEPIVRIGLNKLIPWDEYGFQVVCEAQNGIEALEQLDMYKIDVVITDIEMPNMDGMEYIKRINNRKIKPLIVILTAYAEFEYAKTAIEYGVTGYILKPIIESQICDILRQIKKTLYITVEREFNSELDNQLIDAVLFADHNAYVIMEKIIDEERKYSVTDINGTYFRFLYILETIVNNVNKKYRNLNKLEKLDGYINMKNKQFLNKADLIFEFKQEIVIIFEIIEKYYLSYKDNIVRQACNYVVDHIDEKIRLTEISTVLGISKNYFCSLFKQKIGENFLDYVTKLKMQRAKYLLKEKNLRIYEVSNLLGYVDTTYFTQLFKKYCDMTPNEYKKAECENYEFMELE
ncbi:MAG TPA: response regulator [Mobilitalea sp.]|nr:response regulator [Mobilitalea sp.]